jgi:hypothetical protein
METRIVIDTCPTHGLALFRVQNGVKECAKDVDEQIAQGRRPATDRVRLLRPR